MGKARDDLYQRLHGFKTINRGYKREGQSDWYYVDPRYDDDDPRGKIDVESENSPNPRLNDILDDDMRRNPQDYYIWRTKKDDRVRGKHAEREGEIFNWHVPPEGGHPGEDYNCRCRAEPYEPEKYKKKPMIINVGGLEMFKELQSEMKPVDFKLNGLPQYAANDKANTASDAVYASNYEYAHRKVKFRSPEEEKLLRHMADVIVESEAEKRHPYLDSKGLITTGKGNNINSWEQFKSVNWMIGNRPATEDEVKAMYDELGRQRERLQKEYDELQKFKREHPLEYAKWPESKKKDNGAFNYTAGYYIKYTNIRISQEEVDYHTFTHLQNDYDVLKKAFAGFDNQPLSFKEAVFDIQYNVRGGINSFGKFIDAYDGFMQTHNKRYFNEMLKQSHRKDVDNDRNVKTAERILRAYKNMVSSF